MITNPDDLNQCGRVFDTAVGYCRYSTPLGCAAMGGYIETMKALIQKGASIDAACKGEGCPPLGMAAYGGHLDAVKLLLDLGANSNQREPLYGHTPLMLAIIYGSDDATARQEVVQLLLDAGADINIESNLGKTALSLAQEKKRLTLTKLLEDAMADLRRPARVERLKRYRANLALLESRRSTIESAEKAGDAETMAGRHNVALERYIVALKQTPGGTDPEHRIREKVIKLVKSMKPPPPDPEEARLHAERTQAFLKKGEDALAFLKGIEEMEKALLIAPWWADAYFNLGLLQEKVVDYAGAIRSFKLYLLATPHAPDAQAVRKKIIELEVAHELEEKRREPAPAAPKEQPRPR